ncbi:MAG: hypothetical protein J6L24_05845 [Oscillospiraceae bacterium]|nr:hypothetical protein [Oscillospiraceae bacterium]
MYQGKYENNNPETDARSETSVESAAAAPEQVPNKPAVKPKKAKKKATKGTVIFYSVYGGVSALILLVFLCLLIPLRSWLVKYEASQPERKCAEVFEYLFADPDWKILYGLAGVADTAFENENAYAAYMEAKVGNAELTYTETSAGLSGDCKYIVRFGDEKIASFTLTNNTDKAADVPVWELGTVEIFFDRGESVTVEKLPGYTVYINGVALDDSYTVRTTATRAEEYLPEGVHGYRTEQQYIDGLLVQPEVTVRDERGNPVTMAQDAETGIYSPVLPAAPEMTEEERNLALNAAKADAKYSMRAITAAELRRYFDANTQVYKDIIANPVYVQNYRSYSFDENTAAVSEYCRYSDKLFSANVKLTMNVIRSNGTTKVFELDKTYFFTLNAAGNYLVTQYTNAPIQETVESVRLTFIQDGEQVESRLVNTDAATLTLPEITVPEGKVLTGWAVQSDDGSGKITMTVIFTPGENGEVSVSGSITEPMTLYAVFENKSEVE